MRLGDEVCDWQDSGDSGCPRILRLELLVKKQQRKNLGGGQARGVHQPVSLEEPPSFERQGNVGKYLLLLSDFLTAEGKANDSKYQKRKTNVAKSLKRPLPTVDWTALSVDVCRVDGALAAVLTLIMFESGTVRSKSGEAGVAISLTPSPRE